MARLRSSREREAEPELFDDTLEAGPVGALPGGETSGGEGNPFKPIELNPGQSPVSRPPQQRASRGTPTSGAGPVDSQVFAGGGSNTLSPPSVTQNQPSPTAQLRAPSMESMVFPAQGGGGRLFGNRGGQFGGGLSLGADSAQQGAEDPSSLIMQLLQLLG